MLNSSTILSSLHEVRKQINYDALFCILVQKQKQKVTFFFCYFTKLLQVARISSTVVNYKLLIYKYIICKYVPFLVSP